MESLENSTLLNRGIADFIEKDKIIKKIQAGEKLRIKFGIDPTGCDLTLGHAVALRKLKQFQDAGHQIVLLFGTFTAQIGDPTGKTQTRKILTKDEVLKNAKTYLEQAGKILDVSKIEVVYNGDWLEQLSFAEVLNIAGTFTVAQMLERDMFQDRIKNNQEINLVEFLYPLMQGYDSVHLKADIEIGGNDQKFNLLMGTILRRGRLQSLGHRFK
jgi:tyrosyl-tRNA synthetase